MPEPEKKSESEIDWSLTTFEGVRRKHHEKFMAQSLREKIQALEDMEELIKALKMNQESNHKTNPTDETSSDRAEYP